jgi:serine/threonine protein kinase/tetratricopeptide (TPR) repeat protein
MQGRTLLHYHFLEKLGEGGMGLVYKARDETLGRLVAIKVLPDARLDPSSRSRFFLEARTASALNHPNIITIHEIASCESTEMIVMEYVEGHTLGALLQSGPLPLSDVFKYAIQIADALGKAHAAGIIHRDIKPGNIMVTGDGLVKVVDFGLAKVQPGTVPAENGAPTLELTGARVVLGTVAYMSPEQATGDPLDARSDIFSFGVLLFEMIGGRRPFEGKTTMEVLHQLLAPEAVAVDALLARAPSDLVRVVSRALAKDREQRFRSTDEMRHALRAAHNSTMSGVVPPIMTAPDAPTTSILLDGAPVARAASRESQAASVPPKRRRLRRALAFALAAASGVMILVSLPGLQWWGGTSAGRTATDSNKSSYQHFAAGQALLKRHDRRADLDRAIIEFTAAIEKDPSYAPGYAGLADAYYWKNALNTDAQWKRLAMESATQAVRLNPDLGIAHTAMGRALMVAGRPDDAETHLTRALAQEPGQAAALISLAAIAAERKDLATAEARYREAAAAAPRDWQPLAELGQLLYKSARYQEAVDVWEQTARLVDDSASLHRQLGAAYHMLGDPDAAAKAFQRALQIEPTASVYNNLGTLRFFQGQYADSVAAFRRAIELRANSYLYWGNLGDAHRWNPPTKHEAADAYATAIRLARDAISARPNDLDLRATIAVYRAKSGDKKQAAEDIAAVDNAPKPSPSMLFKSTVVHELTGNRKAALASLERTLEAGYSLREIQTEPELISLRTDPQFHLIASRAAK